MTKIKLFLFIFLGSSLSVFGQSTFTLLPKFHVGDTLVYKAKTLNNQNLLNAVPNVNVISRTFQLIVKSEDSNGNLKVDYVMKDVEMGEFNEVLKQISIAERIEKFFKEDILRIPIQLTINPAGRLLSIDNKDEIANIYMERMFPIVIEIAMKAKKYKPTDKEIQEAKEAMKEKFDIEKMLEEIPGLFKYYGQPLMEGKSETVDSVTTKYIVARMDDGTTWLKTDIDLMHGKEEIEKANPSEEFLSEEGGEDSEEDEEPFELNMTATMKEDYKFDKEGIVTYLKIFATIGMDSLDENNTDIEGGTEATLLEIRR